MMKHALLTSVAVIGLLSACAVGPDFKTPVVPDARRFTDSQ